MLQLKFNVLVTTYEFIMRDRAKLSKVNWQYAIIDEAQRLKDREGDCRGTWISSGATVDCF